MGTKRCALLESLRFVIGLGKSKSAFFFLLVAFQTQRPAALLLHPEQEASERLRLRRHLSSTSGSLALCADGPSMYFMRQFWMS
jgi:hypothetical protein